MVPGPVISKIPLEARGDPIILGKDLEVRYLGSQQSHLRRGVWAEIAWEVDLGYRFWSRSPCQDWETGERGSRGHCATIYFRSACGWIKGNDRSLG